MSLHNRPANQSKISFNSKAIKNASSVFPAQPLDKKSVLQPIPEKKPLVEKKLQQQGFHDSKTGVLDSKNGTTDTKQRIPPTRMPTLSTLRENLPTCKRQKILQEVVRTAGKENGFLTFRNRPDAVTDIYATDVDNESLVVAYVEHIYAYLFHREVIIPRTYMDGMSINPRMRAILVDWIVSVAHKFKMCQDTLFLSLNIVDRFLSIPEIDATKDELQLIGVTAMFIAGKFEEVYPPDIEDYVFISDHACTKTQILEAEMMIVTALNFDFTRPLPAHFLRRVCKAAQASPDEYSMAKYFTEISQLNVDFVEIKPSLTAAASLYLTLLARRGRRKDMWDADLVYYGNYEEAEVKEVACKMFEIVRDAPKSRHQCIVKKYSVAKNYGVSNIAESTLGDVGKYLGASPARPDTA